YQDKIAVHHGSLNKEVRLDVENQLKEGKMKAVFSSTSLEMGIDIGSIDLTVQLGSPKTVRALMQRIGRSGHSQNLVSKGKILVFGRDDLLECTVIAKLAKEGKIDAIRVPESPSDVLAQILVGMALEQKWDFEEAYAVISRSYPFRKLSYDEFLEMLEHVADPTKDEDSWKYGHIWVDSELQEFGRRKSARQAYLQNIGTIPDAATIDVVLRGFRNTIGQISEKFAEKLQETDIFVLGGKSYEFLRTVGEKILVEAAPGRVPTVPSWGGEALTRTLEVSKELERMLVNIEQRIDRKEDALHWLLGEYPIGKLEADTIFEYVLEQYTISSLPMLDRFVVERYTDPGGMLNILILSLYGLETNQALMQLFGKLLSDELGQNIATLATDNGILLKIPPGFDVEFQTILQRLEGIDIEQFIKPAILTTEMYRTRFRHAAGRSLMILRRWGKRSLSVSQQKRSASWLLKSLPTSSPIRAETFREILFDTYNTNQAREVLSKLVSGDIQVIMEDSGDIPSPLTHDILLNGELDVILLEDRRNLLTTLHQQVIARILPEIERYNTILDPTEVKEYFSRKIGEAVDLNTRIDQIARLPLMDKKQWIQESWGTDEEKLIEILRSNPDLIEFDNSFTTIDELPFYLATSKTVDLALEEEKFIEIARDLALNISPEDAWSHLILRVLEFKGPLSLEDIANALQVEISKIESIVLRLQRQHIILKGKFISQNMEYIRRTDRDQLLRSNVAEQQITEDQLKNFRLAKMRLIDRGRSDRVGIVDYLRENGPARDPTELVARLGAFNWRDLRSLLIKREVYFGRFLGKRLVFIDHEDLHALILITREFNHQLSSEASEILEILSQRTGLSQSEISNLTKLTMSQTGAALRELENQLFVSRVGFDLTLVHGGFPNPRYIPLPLVEYSETDYWDSVVRVLERCCHWYGPLTLNDCLRITRLSYQTVEEGLRRSELEIREILGSPYYGWEYSFDTLDQTSIHETELQEVFLLSPLDPFFYMTSGSFRRDYLPRQSRLSIVQGGLSRGYVEISIPDKDILQVINLQIQLRDRNNYVLLKGIGRELKRIAKTAYETPVVFIEEIRYLAAAHPDNKNASVTLEEVGYALYKDALVSGTGLQSEFNADDLYLTRLIQSKRRLMPSDIALEEVITQFSIIEEKELFSVISGSHENLKLLISHLLRQGIIHYQRGKFYRADLFESIHGIDPLDPVRNRIFYELNTPKSSSELVQVTKMEKSKVIDTIRELLETGMIELVSPYARSLEYRQMPSRTKTLRERLEIIVYGYLQWRGPLTFQQLLSDLKEFAQTEITRSQLLITLGTLFDRQQISSAVIHFDERKREVAYFTHDQAKIMGNADKKQYFKGWEIYDKSDGRFELPGGDNSAILYNGNMVASFGYERDGDTGIISNFSFQSSSVEKLPAMISKLEDYVFGRGMRSMRIEMLGNSLPTYWLDLEG
ncbi:MAG: helicase-related protein, partial [Candidatus Kariarchaeaceae archaeon]